MNGVLLLVLAINLPLKLCLDSQGKFAQYKRLKSDSHVQENFCQIEIFPSQIPSFVCLVFKIENKQFLKLQNSFS